MGAIKSQQDIAELGTILCVGAHPDDETWIAGGLLAAAADNGQRVLVLTATKGEAGTANEARWPQANIAKIRTQELHRALQILGVSEHGWLDCQDGDCDCVDCEMMAARLAAFIDHEEPDTILTFGPEGLTGHTDHRAVSEWCSLAVEHAKHKPAIYHAVHTHDWYEKWGRELHEQTSIFFNIDEPPVVAASQLAIEFMLPTEFCELKYQALWAQPSQMEELLSKFKGGKLPEALAQECFIKRQ